MTTLERTFNIVVALVTTLLVIAALVALARYFYHLVALLGIVLVFTYILLAPVDLVERAIAWCSAQCRRMAWFGAVTEKTPTANPRILAVIIVYFVFFMGLTIASIQLAPRLNKELHAFGDNFTDAVNQVSSVLVDWSGRHFGMDTLRRIFGEDIQQAKLHGEPRIDIPDDLLPATPQVRQIVQTLQDKAVIQDTVSRSTVAQAVQWMQSAMQGTVDNVVTLVTGTLTGFVYFLSALLLIFYCLLDGQKLHDDLLIVLPEPVKDTAAYFLSSFHRVMFSFIKGQVLMGCLTGTYMFFVYSFLGVPYPFFLSCIFALCEILPVVGTYLGLTPGVLVALFSVHPINALWVWGCSYAYQHIKDNIIAPRVVGEVLGLHPMVIILALVISAHVAGLVGVLFALPLASALNVVVRYVSRTMAGGSPTAEAG